MWLKKWKEEGEETYAKLEKGIKLYNKLFYDPKLKEIDPFVYGILRGLIEYPNKGYSITNKIIAMYIFKSERSVNRSLKRLQDNKYIICKTIDNVRYIFLNMEIFNE